MIFLYNCNYNNCSCNCECLVYIYSLVAFNVYTLKNDKKKLQIKKKKYFVKRVSFDEEKDVFAAKKDNGYMFIITSRFKFLDVKIYIGPGLTYDVWCRSMGCKIHKLAFPYEWLDSYKKLNLPCHNIVFQYFSQHSTVDV